MKNNPFTSSLYFSRQPHFKQNIYRGCFIFKNTSNKKESHNKTRYETNYKNSDQEDSVITTSSVQHINTQMKCFQDQSLDRSSTNASALISRASVKIYEPKLLPQLSNTQHVIRVKLQSRQMKTKPVIVKQRCLDHTVQINYLNKDFQELKYGAHLKSIYYSSRENNLNTLVIINFENLLMHTKRSFWENKNEIKLCHGYLISSPVEYCYSPYCPCNLRSDLKTTLRILSKLYLIALVFTNKTYSIVWHNYFIENNYQYDAIYVIKQPINTDFGGLKLNKILKQFRSTTIMKLIIFDQIDNSTTFPKIDVDQFQYKLPIIGQNDIDILYIIMAQSNNRLQDSRSICDILTSISHDQSHVVSRRQLNFLSIDLTNVWNYYINVEKLIIEKQKNLFKVGELREQIKYNLKNFDINFHQQSDDFVFKWVDHTRNLILEQLKAKSTEKIPLIHFTVGDLIVRNHQFKKQYFNSPQSILAEKQCKIQKKIIKINAEQNNFMQNNSNRIRLNCLLCVEQ